MKLMTVNASRLLRHVGACWSALQRSAGAPVFVSAHVRSTSHLHVGDSQLSHIDQLTDGCRAPVQLQPENLFIIS